MPVLTRSINPTPRLTITLSPLLIITTLCGQAAACPITSALGGGAASAPGTAPGLEIQVNPSLLLTDINIIGATGCTGVHDFLFPDPAATPPSLVVSAVAAPKTFMDYFFASTGSASLVYQYPYSIQCAPCPQGTTMNLLLSGSALWTQYASATAIAGVATATSGVSGSVTAPPFAFGAPFTIGPNPAVVTAATPALGSVTAGNPNPLTTTFSSIATQPCPLAQQFVTVSVQVDANRSAGATTAIAAFNNVTATIRSTCSCPPGPPNVGRVDSQGAVESGNPEPIPTPSLRNTLDLIEQLFSGSCGQFFLLDDGTVSMIQGLPSPEPQDLISNGPRSVRAFLPPGAPTPLQIGQPLGLVSSVARGNRPGGPFSTHTLVAAEALPWDSGPGQFRAEVNSLKLFNLPTEPAFELDLPLSRPLRVPSAIAFGNETPVFGNNLLAALPESGEIVSISDSGQVTNLQLSPPANLGRPTSLALTNPSGPWNGNLLVTDIGARRADGNGVISATGRLLTVNAFNRSVQTLRVGLRAPTAVTTGDGTLVGLPGQEVIYLLAAGLVDQVTGELIRGSGELSAILPGSQQRIILASRLDAPTAVSLRSPTELVVATATQILIIGPRGCIADFNRSNDVTVQDIFDFLSAYFAGDPRADINRLNGITVQDIFDFLGAYFLGCS